MNHILMLAAAGTAAGNPFQEISREFGFNWPQFAAQVISFLIVALLLAKFAYNPILRVLEARRERIREGLENADRIKAELARTEAQRQEVLDQANAEANTMIQEARAAATRVRDHETQRAIMESEQIVARAREAAELERARIFAEARRELGRLVVLTTSRVTGKILTPEDQRRLAEETTRQLAE